MATIKPKDYEYYLVEFRCTGEKPCPSGFAICQYVNGYFFDEQREETVDEYCPVIIKHLTTK